MMEGFNIFQTAELVRKSATEANHNSLLHIMVAINKEAGKGNYTMYYKPTTREAGIDIPSYLESLGFKVSVMVGCAEVALLISWREEVE